MIGRFKTKVFGDTALDPNLRDEIEKFNIAFIPEFPSSLIAKIKVRAIIWPLMAFIYAFVLVKYSIFVLVAG